MWTWGATTAERALVKKVKGCTRSLDGHSSCEIEWSHDSRFFVTRWEKNAVAYNTQGNEVHSYHQDDDIYAIQLSADSKFIAVSSNNYSIVFDVASHQRIRVVPGAGRHYERH